MNMNVDTQLTERILFGLAGQLTQSVFIRTPKRSAYSCQFSGRPTADNRAKSEYAGTLSFLFDY